MIEKIKEIINSFKKVTDTTQTDSKVILKQQWIKFLLLALGVIIFFTLILSMAGGSNSSLKVAKMEDGSVNIETANKAIDPDKMWRNHFEDKLTESDSKVDNKLDAINKTLEKKEKDIENNTKLAIESLEHKLNFAREELKSEIDDLKKNKNLEADSERNSFKERNYLSQKFDNEHNIVRPQSTRTYIPETAYVTGVLLGGLVTSTATNSQDNAIPLTIRITDRGNLPKNFIVDLRDCRILGSGYGQLNSQRGELRAEKLVCIDRKNELIYTTAVAGIIYGDDGANGVKGKVIDPSSKHLKNAMIGGVIGGFSKTLKSQEQLTFNSAGAFQTKNSSLTDRFTDGTLGSLGNAGEKIADLEISKIQAMSPVISIKSGAKVNILFTKGVHFGSIDVKERIKDDRKTN